MTHLKKAVVMLLTVLMLFTNTATVLADDGEIRKR